MDDRLNILLLAPHPFYQDRGTPIAVNLILKVLSERGDQVHVLTYHEGKDIRYDHVTVYRISNIPFIRHIRPGFSWKKLVCDVLMFFKAIYLAFRNHYHLVHAVEESVFIALLLKGLFKLPYVYDMDSSLVQQMLDKYTALSRLAFLLNFLERLAVRNAKAVVPVCEALRGVIEPCKPEKVMILQDISLLKDGGCQTVGSLRRELDAASILLMYVGNLEPYQGIDLLLESFALILTQTDQADLVIIGGEAADIQKYRKKAEHLGIERKVHFLGPKPVEDLAGYLLEPDILVAPRIMGKNTPMKIYSYLHSGKPVLATNLPTHTQLLSSDVAMLADPSPEAFARGMFQLIEDERLRVRLGRAGQRLIEEKYTYPVFREKVNSLYNWLKSEIDQGSAIVASRVKCPMSRQLR
jgi:glycosyltransferase involved in cell wall biosynthesis